MATNNSWNSTVSSQNVTFNGGTMNIGTDATDNSINIGTNASAQRNVTIGNIVGSSATAIKSGSGALSLTSTNGAITANSGTGTVSIGSDATAATYNIATGAGVKAVTVGTTNTTSSLALKYGTADFTLASATGTTIAALDTGEVTSPLQPSFCAVLSANKLNVTGNATVANISANTEIYDVGNNYNNSTFTFTAPVTGKYFFWLNVTVIGCTIASQLNWYITTSNNTYNASIYRAASNLIFAINGSISADMDAGDTTTFSILTNGEAGATDDLYGSNATDGCSCGGILLH